jgi:hypothetical protein
MIEAYTLNIIIGVIILILNLIPLFTKPKYFEITLPLSILIAVIRILFIQ